MKYGFKASKIDGSELKFEEQNGLRVPNEYSYIKYLPDVLNQGQQPICVPCSVSTFINWKLNAENGDNKVNNKVDLNAIYDSRTDKSDDDGMTFKDAFHYLRHNGVKTNEGNIKIGRYAKIGSIIQLKQAIVVNGPCFGALPVWNSVRDNFWKKAYGDSLEGGHAIAIVGYNEEGFIIRNSWGQSYGNEGNVLIPYEDFDTFLELWTVIE